MGETSKHRALTLPYCAGEGVDLGSGDDPIQPRSIRIDLDPRWGQIVGDAASLTWFHDETLDYVYASHLLEYFSDWQRCLGEWARVLKPGGYLVLLAADRSRFAAAVAAGQPPNSQHRRLAEVGELSEIVASKGVWDVLCDEYADRNGSDYNIVFVARKLGSEAATADCTEHLRQLGATLRTEQSEEGSGGAHAVLVQAASGDQVALLDLTYDHHRRYAERFGLDYLCLREPLQGERSPHWDKLAIIMQLLQEGRYAQIFWLDADTLIVDHTQDLREALPDSHWIGMVRHGIPPHFNSGVMLLRSCPECLSLFQRAWERWPVHHAWEEQLAIHEALREMPDGDRTVYVLDDAWNSTHNVNESLSPIVSAWHGGGSAQRRREFMQAALERCEVLPPGLQAVSN